MKRKPNPTHLLFETHLRELGIGFLREHRFHKERKWRFDYVIGPILGYLKSTDSGPTVNIHHPTRSFAIEIDGGVYSQGRHTRGKGREMDMRKINAATMMGYRVLSFSTNMVNRGEALAFLREHLK